MIKFSEKRFKAWHSKRLLDCRDPTVLEASEIWFNKGVKAASKPCGECKRKDDRLRELVAKMAAYKEQELKQE